MLRLCQPTVRAWDVCGPTSSAQLIRGIYSRRLRRQLYAGPSQTLTPRTNSILDCTYVTRRISSYSQGSKNGTLDKDAIITALPPVVHEPSTGVADSTLAAFATISDFLSFKNTTSSTTKPSLDTLRDLYHSVKVQGQLRLFSPKQFTELISLYGTLSLPDTRDGLIYLSKLAPSVAAQKEGKEQWDFVIELSRDKQKMFKMKLNGTDGFWLMRALLTKVDLAEGETSLSPDDPRKRALTEATQHYLRIWRHAYDVEIHLPLIQKWFDLDNEKDTETLVNRLCRVLEYHIYPNSRLIEILWRLILRSTIPLVPPLQARILSMVKIRLSAQFALTRQEYWEKKIRNSSYVSSLSSPQSEHPSQSMSTPDLSNALGSALFPTYAPGTRPAPPEIDHWATEQARQAFGPHVTPEAQWGNLLLLAIHQAQRLNLPALPPPPPPPQVAEEEVPATSETQELLSGDWRPVLMLSALERGTSGQGPRMLAPSMRENVQEIVRPLWRSWKAGDDGTRSLNISASRSILASFLRLAAKVVDGPLTDAIHRFCVKHDLFRGGKIAAEAASSWADLNAAYVLAVAACRGVGWQTAFEETHISGNRNEVLNTLFFHYVLTDLRIAHQVYMYAQERSYPLKEKPVYAMGVALAKPQTWQLCVPVLEHPGVSRQRKEEILIAILRIFQSERRQFVEPVLAKTLGDTLWKLYEHVAPPSRFKYPIRFFFSILITSEQPTRAITVVEAIHRNASPTFFTTRLLLRLMRTLVRHRYIHLTHRVHRLISTDPADARAAADFRRKLTVSLARAGANKAAQRAYSFGVHSSCLSKVWRTPREAMARAVKFNVRSPSPKHTLAIMSILRRAPTHAPTIQYAITLLVRAGRASAARNVLKRSLSHLDDKILTTIGNMILDSLLRQHLLRNGRLVRHMMRTKEHLESEYGFKPDRVTINVLINALLRWRGMLDAMKIRSLFDHMVRCGYPASEQRRRPTGDRKDGGVNVPFGTSAASLRINVPNLGEKILFEKHVRPLYKMFVKALHARGDHSAARAVLGILKEEELRSMRMKQERNQARTAGLVVGVGSGKIRRMRKS
ncbi:hypothetical protein H0H87_005939 [Tephrocybe sp. NHM501043]|nr:hypothetical protein H0H87_005939 [Tephrocybe sp. NHM501043]